MEEDREPEVWKEIPDSKGLYEVSSWGRVRRIMIIVPNKSRSGYPLVRYQVDNEKYNVAIHLLVGSLFCQKRDYQVVVNHKDSDIMNNYYKNLEWCSIRENVSHSKMKGEFTSEYTGVYLNKRSGKYISAISIKGKRRHLGCFDTEEEACYVYMKVVSALGEENKYYKKMVEYDKNIDISIVDEIVPPRNYSSKYRGVQKMRSGRWKASININRKRIDLGLYDNEEDAYRAYVEAANKYR